MDNQSNNQRIIPADSLTRDSYGKVYERSPAGNLVRVGTVIAPEASAEVVSCVGFGFAGVSGSGQQEGTQEGCRRASI